MLQLAVHLHMHADVITIDYSLHGISLYDVVVRLLLFVSFTERFPNETKGINHG